MVLDLKRFESVAHAIEPFDYYLNSATRKRLLARSNALLALLMSLLSSSFSKCDSALDLANLALSTSISLAASAVWTIIDNLCCLTSTKPSLTATYSLPL